MVRTFAALLATAALAAAQTTTTAAPGTTAAPAAGGTTAAPAAGGSTWKFTTINSIQARVVSDAPTWDPTAKKFGLKMKQNTETFPLQYEAAMDTVNTASVEGALFYVQTEGIHAGDSVACMRKTNMSYIWFLSMTIVQPNFAIAEYADDGGVVPEFGKFVAMDNGICTPLDSKGTFSPECMTISGLNYHKNIGPYVGGESRKKHPKAEYADNYWFSFPNSCYTKKFGEKTDKCRTAQKGGLCPIGVQPDGIKCTFSYEVLGYISIDDLVGITNITDSNGKKMYRDRVAFCKDNKIEYNFDNDKSDLTFWDKPLDVEANTNRTKQMLTLYNSLLADGTGMNANMKKLPSVEELSAKNPPCWKNSPKCAAAPNGCRRKLTAQICEVCESPAADCKKPTASDVVPPKLTKAVEPPLPTDATGKTTQPRGGAVEGAGGTSAKGSSASAATAALSVFVGVALLLA